MIDTQRTTVPRAPAAATILAAGCLVAVLVVAACFRLPRLAVRPMHPDEANQAFKAGTLYDTGVYRYDTAEHHGPTLYWLTLPSLWLSGAKDFAHSGEAAYRLVPVLFGLGLIALVWVAADGLGRGAAVAAGLFAAVSPAMIYYARYYVQETLLVFFTFAAIALGWRWVRSGSVGWAAAAGASLGLMHATKETWILSGASMVAGMLLSLAWGRWRDGGGRDIRSRIHLAPLLAALAAGCLVAAAFYSSFGRNWLGPWDSLRAYASYFRRGSEGGIHTHPWYFYLELLLAFRPARGFFWTEGLIVSLALVGGVAALAMRPLKADGDTPSAGPSPGLWRFLAFYTAVLTLLYAAIPYKTPWCMLSFLHGMTLLAGLGAWSILRWLPGLPAKGIAAALLAAGVVHLGWQGYALSFRFAADQRNPYVYAHTSSDALKLAGRLEQLADVSPDGHEMMIHVVTPDNYWPLPWYLRRFDPDHVGYWEDAAAWRKDGGRLPPPSVILLTGDVQEVVDAGLRAAYNQQMIYGLRPGVLVSCYVREDLWQAYLAAAAAGPSPPKGL